MGFGCGSACNSRRVFDPRWSDTGESMTLSLDDALDSISELSFSHGHFTTKIKGIPLHGILVSESFCTSQRDLAPSVLRSTLLLTTHLLLVSVLMIANIFFLGKASHAEVLEEARKGPSNQCGGSLSSSIAARASVQRLLILRATAKSSYPNRVAMVWGLAL